MARKKASEGSCSRKRTSEESPPLSNEPKKRRFIHEKKDNYEQDLSKKDKYCWICHSKELTDDMWYFWPCCPRIYHFNCLSDYPSSKSETTCPECRLECVDGTELSKPVPRLKLKELLMSVIQKYLDDDKKGKKSNERKRKKETKKKFKLLSVFLQWPLHAETDIIKVVDFTYLTNKIRKDTYSKASEFFSDVKWILHNCHLLYGAQSTVTKDAGKLVQLIKADLLDIEACHECCYHGTQNSGFFIKLCNPPHQIIWAQISGWSYWAAKCLKVSHETVYVKFFGTHQIGKLSVSKCLYISRNHPNYSRPVPKTKGYNDSITELKDYIQLYERQRKELFKYYDNPENAGKNNPKELFNIHLDYTLRTLQEDSSSPVLSNNLASDDLRLGADFSNLNNPASEHSDDQMSSIDRAVIADVTHTTPSSTLSPLPYFNGHEPSIFNQHNSLVHPQVEEIPSSGETVEARSNHPVAKQNIRPDDINAIIRYFSNGNGQLILTPEMVHQIYAVTKWLVQNLARCKSNHLTSQEVLLTQQNKELKNQLLKQRSQFEEEKKLYGEKIRNECDSEIMEHKDRALNAHMLLRNIGIDSSENMRKKENEFESKLCEKQTLLEEYKEKLIMMEAENIELKKKLESFERKLPEKENLLEEYQEKLRMMEAKNNELKNELESDCISRAKRYSYCYACLKSATILCCPNASFCSENCQKKCKDKHKMSCLKGKNLVYQKECHKTIEVTTRYEVKNSREEVKNIREEVKKTREEVKERSPAPRPPPKKDKKWKEESQKHMKGRHMS